MKRRSDIPKKNYYIFTLIFCITVAITLTIFIIYNNQKNYENSIPVIRGKMAEIEAKDLDNYLSENNSALLYIGVASDENSRYLEPKLLEVKENRNLNIIYVNITSLKDKKAFLNKFNNKYGNGKEIISYPAFVIIREGKVFDYKDRNGRELYIGDIEQLLDIYEINGEDNE